jgi:NADPH:quinone reductase-like Zn-dependent oxidoreductase
MRVRASSLYYRDLMVLQGGGRGPTRLGVVPLSDGAGEVAAIGDGVTRVKVGDQLPVASIRGGSAVRSSPII